MKRTVNFCVVGLGRIGAMFDVPLDKSFPKSHCGAITLHKNAKLVAVVDKNRERLKRIQKYFGVNGYDNLEDVFKRENVDVVVIATPESQRLNIIKKISDKVKFIVCEKPIAKDMRTAHKIADIIKKKNILMPVNFIRRWHTGFWDLKKKLEKGMIGDIQNVIEMYLYDSPGAGSHQIDLNRFLFGEALWIQPMKKHNEGFDCVVRHERSTVNYIGCSQQYYTMGETVIWGTKGRIEVVDGGTSFKIFLKKEDRFYKNYFRLYPADYITIKSDYKMAMYNLIDNIVKSALGLETPFCSIDDGLRCQQLLTAVKRSVRTNKKMTKKDIANY